MFRLQISWNSHSHNISNVLHSGMNWKQIFLYLDLSSYISNPWSSSLLSLNLHQFLWILFKVLCQELNVFLQADMTQVVAVQIIWRILCLGQACLSHFSNSWGSYILLKLWHACLNGLLSLSARTENDFAKNDRVDSFPQILLNVF